MSISKAGDHIDVISLIFILESLNSVDVLDKG